jgi:hypothetical protein
MSSISDYREKLGKISAAMIKIHKLLMEDEMEARERVLNKSIPPAERLNVLLNDPEFAWLRALSQLMAFVDEIYFQKEAILDRQLIEAEEKVTNLFSLVSESEFSYRYRNKLATIPDLMVEHGLLKVALKQEPSR